MGCHFSGKGGAAGFFVGTRSLDAGHVSNPDISGDRVYAHRIATHPFELVNALWTAHWSGDPKQLRDAIYLARVAGMTKPEIARELRTTVRHVTAAITFAVT